MSQTDETRKLLDEALDLLGRSALVGPCEVRAYNFVNHWMSKPYQMPLGCSVPRSGGNLRYYPCGESALDVFRDGLNAGHSEFSLGFFLLGDL